ncbi:MAG TPA: substrate-binding domain-containing protein [Candidatus Baltobacteraceae bacterium]|nr:substrate-binding domain-containing protein [Candidatus Baltobacteraceae bacterium]
MTEGNPDGARRSSGDAKRLKGLLKILEAGPTHPERIAALGMGAAALSGCNPPPITVAGSTALLPLMLTDVALFEEEQEQTCKKNENQHKERKTICNITVINATGGGSRFGIAQAETDPRIIGASDFPASSKDSQMLVDHVIAASTFAVIVKRDSGVSRLTREQVQRIFSGELKNWKEVGGNDLRIYVITRPISSGTRAEFMNSIMKNRRIIVDALLADSTKSLTETMKMVPGSISYAVFPPSMSREKEITPVVLDGIAPTNENVISGKYTFWGYEHLLTNGPPVGDAKRFIEFVKDHQPEMRKLGYIPMSDMKRLARR